MLHQALVPHLPSAPAAVLDMGVGSGRDAAWLAGQGHSVIAVEPSATMRGRPAASPAAGHHLDADSLPGLEAVFRLGAAFDVILLSAVWMHVPPADRPRAFRKLLTLLKPGGTLALSLRLGPPGLIGTCTRPMLLKSKCSRGAMALWCCRLTIPLIALVEAR
jgi:SAM-dependent methyltransferase